MTTSRLRWAARLCSVLVVLAITLVPESDGKVAHLAPLCLACGTRGAVDLLLNAALFVPFGASVARPGQGARGVLLALGLGAALSGLVEAGQIPLGGRHSALGDLVANTAGSAAGGALAVTARSWLRPSPTLSARLSIIWGSAAALVFLGSAALVTPSFPASVYWVQWAPRLAQFDTLRGEVVSARAGRRPVPPGRMTEADRERLLEVVEGRENLVVRARFGAAPEGLAPVVSVFDGQQREILVLGRKGSDLIVRVRRVADDLRLHRPQLRAEDVLSGATDAGSRTVTLRWSPGTGSWTAVRGRELCLEVAGERRCGLGHPAGRGWSLLFQASLPEPVARSLDAAWVGLVFLPLGFWGRLRWKWGVGLAVAGAGLLLSSAVGPVVAAGIPESGGLVAGLVLGLLVRHLTGATDGERREGEPSMELERGVDAFVQQ